MGPKLVWRKQSEKERSNMKINQIRAGTMEEKKSRKIPQYSAEKVTENGCQEK